MERTPQHPSLPAVAPVITDTVSENICSVCNEKILEDHESLNISECNHTFHRNCIEAHLSECSECPLCKRPCSLAELKKVPPPDKFKTVNRGRPRGAMGKQYNTRSYSRSLFPDRSQAAVGDWEANNESTTENVHESNSHSSPHVNRNRDTHRFQHNSVPTIDYPQLGRIIENTMSRLLQNLNIVPPDSVRGINTDITQPVNAQAHTGQINTNVPSTNANHNNHYYDTAPNVQPNLNNQPHIDSFRNIHTQNSAASLQTTADNQHMRPDKITSIIRDWHIRFDGSSNGISVDEFLYRVRTLTRENLNNDFSQLCKNLPLLLTGKAQDWYWRYHKQVNQIEWESFCAALKYQYKEFRSNFDIKEEIRSRKMKPNENFETFYEAISSLLDRLDTPMPEQELIEILTRNLRPEIRHELLYVPIFSIAHLRKLVQMRESLLGDEYFRKSMSPKITPNQNVRRQIADLDFCDDNNIPSENIMTELSVDAIQQSSRPVKCWNCDGIGHFWEDCEDVRNIFCYGCGAKNTYKPQCPKCATKKLSRSKN